VCEEEGPMPILKISNTDIASCATSVLSAKVGSLCSKRC
jgi:hypothetical protein